MKQAILGVLLVCSFFQIAAQSIQGVLTQHAGQTIVLKGFDYYKSFELAKTSIDSLGNFTLSYSKKYRGMGVLKTQDKSNLVLALTGANIQVKGIHLKEANSLAFTNSPENTLFVDFAKKYVQGQQVYKAWKYMQTRYAKEPSLQVHKEVLKTINNEIVRIEGIPVKELNKLDKKRYLHWFLGQRTLVSDMPASIYSYPERIPQNIAQFRSIDFTNSNFKTSGLFKELIEGHYFLLENSGKSLDDVFIAMNISTQYLIDQLQGNDALLNEVSGKLFAYFEKRSLFKAAAYLSVTMLNQDQCVLDTELANRFESYQKLKVGAKAPEIEFEGKKILGTLKTNKLLVFGASECPGCKSDVLKLLGYYDGWKAKGIEIVYVSIDTNKTTYEAAYKNAPWQMYCDFKGWKTKAAKEYHLFATPTYFLLDANNTIVLRPRSVDHANAWIGQKL
ncbi:MAG: thioredoxin family protein [Flavobacteriaceae bacterium]|nr:thioredoxin family protein [Flavobacteriaceae bacterium]